MCAFQVLRKFLLRIINVLHEETGDVQKQGRVLISGVTVLCIAHQLKALNQFVATECVSLVEILKLAASRGSDDTDSRCSPYNELLRHNVRYTHTYTTRNTSHNLQLFSCMEFLCKSCLC